MAHVHQHTQPLCFPHIFPTQICQATASHMRTGKRILFIPAQAGDPETDGTKILQQFRIMAKACCALQCQNSRHFSLFLILTDLGCGVSNGNPVTVQVNFPLNGGDFTFKHNNGRNMVMFFHHWRGKAGKALGIAAQFGCTLQINVQLVAFQTAGLIEVLSKQRQRSVTMKVKNRKIH